MRYLQSCVSYCGAGDRWVGGHFLSPGVLRDDMFRIDAISQWLCSDMTPVVGAVAGAFSIIFSQNKVIRLRIKTGFDAA